MYNVHPKCVVAALQAPCKTRLLLSGPKQVAWLYIGSNNVHPKCVVAALQVPSKYAPIYG